MGDEATFKFWGHLASRGELQNSGGGGNPQGRHAIMAKQDLF